MPKTYVNTPITGRQLLDAFLKLSPQELALPIQFYNEPIHPRISLIVNTLDESNPHISFMGSLRIGKDEVPVARTTIDE